MAFSVGDLIATLRADVSGFVAGMSLASKQLTGFKKQTSEIGETLSLGITAPLAALSVAAFKAASDAERSGRAFAATFDSNEMRAGVDGAAVSVTALGAASATSAASVSRSSAAIQASLDGIGTSAGGVGRSVGAASAAVVAGTTRVAAATADSAAAVGRSGAAMLQSLAGVGSASAASAAAIEHSAAAIQTSLVGVGPAANTSFGAASRSTAAFQFSLEGVGAAAQQSVGDVSRSASVIRTALDGVGGAANASAGNVSHAAATIQQSLIGVGRAVGGAADGVGRAVGTAAQAVSAGAARIASASQASADKVGRSTAGVSAALGGVGSAAQQSAARMGAAAGDMTAGFVGVGRAAEVFSEQLARSLGVRLEEVQNQMTSFGRILAGLNFHPEQVVAGSEALTLAAQQIAARFGDIEGVTDKLSLGLAGATRGLRSVGIVIDQTAAKQLALNMGFLKAGEPMTAQARSAANLLLILQAVQKQYGDLSPSMDTPMGRLRQFTAALADATAELGRAFMPAMTAALGVVATLARGVGDAARWFATLPSGVKMAAEGLLVFVAALGPGLLLLGKLAGLFSSVIPVVTGFYKALVVLNGIQITLAGTTGILSVAIGGLRQAWVLLVASLPIAALVGLGLALGYIVTHINEVDQQTTLLEGAVVDGFYGLAIGIVNALKFAADAIQQFAGGPLGLVAQAAAAVNPQLAGVAAAISALGTRGTPGLDALKNKLEATRDTLLAGVADRLHDLQVIIDANADAAGGASTQFTAFSSIVRNLIAALHGVSLGAGFGEQIAAATKAMVDGLAAVDAQATAMRGVTGASFDAAAARAQVLQTAFTALAKAGVGLNTVIGETGLTLRQIGQKGFVDDVVASTMHQLYESFGQINQQARVLGSSFDVAGARSQAMRTAFDTLSKLGIGLNTVIDGDSLTLGELGRQMVAAGLDSTAFADSLRRPGESLQIVTDALVAAETPAQQYRDALNQLKAAAAALMIPFALLGPAVDALGVKFGQALDIGKSLTSGLSGGISNLFQSLGQALGTGQNIFAHLGDTLKKTLGDLMVQVGHAMIEFGVAAQALRLVITNPLAAIAAGAGLVLLGSALAASAQASVNTATGGGGGGASYSAATASVAQPTGDVTIYFPDAGPYPLDPGDPNQLDALQRMIEAAQGRNIKIMRRA